MCAVRIGGVVYRRSSCTLRRANSAIVSFTATSAAIALDTSGSLVSGLVILPRRNHETMADRSYVCPSAGPGGTFTGVCDSTTRKHKYRVARCRRTGCCPFGARAGVTLALKNFRTRSHEIYASKTDIQQDVYTDFRAFPHNPEKAIRRSKSYRRRWRAVGRPK